MDSFHAVSMNGCLTDWLIDWLIHSFIHWFYRWEGHETNEVGKDKATGVVRVRINPKFYRPSEKVGIFTLDCKTLAFQQHFVSFRITHVTEQYICYLSLRNRFCVTLVGSYSHWQFSHILFSTYATVIGIYIACTCAVTLFSLCFAFSSC